MGTKKEMPVSELLQTTAASLSDDAAYLRVMSLGRPESELILLNRLANRISRLGDGLARIAGERTRRGFVATEN